MRSAAICIGPTFVTYSRAFAAISRRLSVFGASGTSRRSVTPHLEAETPSAGRR
jgi:hypothetical protein